MNDKKRKKSMMLEKDVSAGQPSLFDSAYVYNTGDDNDSTVCDLQQLSKTYDLRRKLKSRGRCMTQNLKNRIKKKVLSVGSYILTPLLPN